MKTFTLLGVDLFTYDESFLDDEENDSVIYVDVNWFFSSVASVAHEIVAVTRNGNFTLLRMNVYDTGAIDYTEVADWENKSLLIIPEFAIALKDKIMETI